MHAAIRLLVGRPPEESEPPAPRPWVRKDKALLCCTCDAVYEADGGPCPGCGSKHGWPLAKWLDRTKETS